MPQKKYIMLFITEEYWENWYLNYTTGANLVVSQVIKIGTPTKSRRGRYIGEKIFQSLEAKFDMCPL